MRHDLFGVNHARRTALACGNMPFAGQRTSIQSRSCPFELVQRTALLPVAPRSCSPLGLRWPTCRADRCSGRLHLALTADSARPGRSRGRQVFRRCTQRALHIGQRRSENAVAPSTAPSEPIMGSAISRWRRTAPRRTRPRRRRLTRQGRHHDHGHVTLLRRAWTRSPTPATTHSNSCPSASPRTSTMPSPTSLAHSAADDRCRPAVPHQLAIPVATRAVQSHCDISASIERKARYRIRRGSPSSAVLGGTRSPASLSA